MNITVYCGSNLPKNPKFAEETKNLGKFIGSNGHNLVYGGANSGLMGVLADTVMEYGGETIGVYPKALDDIEEKHSGLSQLIITDNIADRRLKMIELGNVFVALPGGPGTFEEMSEIISLVRIEQLDGRFFGLNIDGYYDDLIRQFDKMRDEEFISEDERRRIVFVESIKELEGLI